MFSNHSKVDIFPKYHFSSVKCYGQGFYVDFYFIVICLPMLNNLWDEICLFFSVAVAYDHADELVDPSRENLNTAEKVSTGWWHRSKPTVTAALGAFSGHVHAWFWSNYAKSHWVGSRQLSARVKIKRGRISTKGCHMKFQATFPSIWLETDQLTARRVVILPTSTGINGESHRRERRASAKLQINVSPVPLHLIFCQ